MRDNDDDDAVIFILGLFALFLAITFACLVTEGFQ
jgi:hypothetical protein